MRRRISDLTDRHSSEPPGGPPSIIRPGEDDVIPGEVVLAVEPDAAAALGSIPAMPMHGVANAAAIGLGESGPLGEALLDLGATAVARVHGPSPTHLVAATAMADDLGLDTTLLVRFDADTSPTDAATRLGELTSVVWAEPNRWREADAVPNDPRYTSQWGLKRIGCEAAWDLETGDPSIVVAVIDSGVDLNHPDLATLLGAGRDFVDFPVGTIPRPGWVFEGDFTGVDNDAQDEVGHGTHVAGTICALSNNGIGVAGVAWNVRLMPLRTLARVRETATGRVSGMGSTAATAAAIRWAADHGARVINLSLGGYGDTQVEREAIAYAVSKDVVVVAAMGNDDTSDPHYPAAYPGVIGVAATDQNDARSVWSATQASNTGPHTDLAAPGTSIVSSYWDDTYAANNGTSMASPHVAGVAALVLSRNPSLSSAEVWEILRSTAHPLRDDPADPVPNEQYGHGLVQADAAVRAARPPLPQPSQPVLACRPSVALPCPTTDLVSCPSAVVRCPSKTCPSVLTLSCPSQDLPCVSRPISSCQSIRVDQCPSQQITTCPPSVRVPCLTRDLSSCRSIRVDQCPSQQVITCAPTVRVPCPTPPIICNVVTTVGCPSEALCPSQGLCPSEGGLCPSLADCPSFPCPPFGGPGTGPGDGPSWSDYDPYGFDPYGPTYG